MWKRNRVTERLGLQVPILQGPMGGGLVTYTVQGRQYIAVTSGRPSAFFGTTGKPSVTIFALP